MTAVPSRAHLKIWGCPVPTRPTYLGAVWRGDLIVPIERIGSRWVCDVSYGPMHQTRMLALIPKKHLRFEWPESTAHERTTL
jgi:hypothetical protein